VLYALALVCAALPAEERARTEQSTGDVSAVVAAAREKVDTCEAYVQEFPQNATNRRGPSITGCVVMCKEAADRVEAAVNDAAGLSAACASAFDEAKALVRRLRQQRN
jgi:hypothetical protein